jgi:hypothetical protein
VVEQRFDRIRWIDRFVLGLVVFNQRREHLQSVAIGCLRLRIEEPQDFLKRLAMVSASLDWANVHESPHSHACHVNAFVRCVASDEPDVADLVRVVNGDDQSVSVALDIEDDAVFADNARICVHPFDVCWRSPARAADVVEPGAQWLLGLGVAFQERAERAPSDNPHQTSV